MRNPAPAACHVSPSPSPPPPSSPPPHFPGPGFIHLPLSHHLRPIIVVNARALQRVPHRPDTSTPALIAGCTSGRGDLGRVCLLGAQKLTAVFPGQAGLAIGDSALVAARIDEWRARCNGTAGDCLTAVSATLGKGSAFLAGDSPTLADIAAWATLTAAGLDSAGLTGAGKAMCCYAAQNLQNYLPRPK